MQKDTKTAIKRSVTPARGAGSKTTRTGASKVPVAKSATTAQPKTVVESEKSKQSAAKAKTATSSEPLKSKASTSGKGSKQPASSKKSTSKAPSGANRLSDEDDPVFD